MRVVDGKDVMGEPLETRRWLLEGRILSKLEERLVST
jgi:hypothetical protein